MEEAMRASDAIKETRSYVVFNTHQLGLHVKESHWQPGYTPGYCATPLEAVDYAIEQAEEKMTAAQARVAELYDMRVTLALAQPDSHVPTKLDEPVDLTKYDDEGVPYTDSEGKNLDDGWG